MFTGIIQNTGRLIGRTVVAGGGARLEARAGSWDPPVAAGESISVQGACLTVSGIHGDALVFDVLAETLARTNLGDKRVGDRLNLERSLRMGDFMGGHLVTGHVDGRAIVAATGRAGGDRVLSIEGGADLLSGIVMKGSVAIDGVSLTISDVSANRFEVRIIPFTWEHTSLHDLRQGDSVNIETDLIGKYVQKYLGKAAENPAGALTMEGLKNAGFE